MPLPRFSGDEIVQRGENELRIIRILGRIGLAGSVFVFLLGCRSCYRGNQAQQLREAAAHNDLRSVRELLTQGADPNGDIGGVQDWPPVPMTAAIDAGNTAMAELLLKSGAAPNLLDEFADSYAYPPLVIAMMKNRWDIFQLLLAHGADVNLHEPGDGGRSVLAIAKAKDLTPDHRYIKRLLQAGAKE